ncbi:TOTE conflict system archaeo-eukaryotic primase domain-containing protein [Lederbergia citri]|uniref:TOTE conflict system primase domain-containing protein n=1 Tax=Lederbergia citri TaxID=2833580 RepID=A0A942TBX3_9BACI|nr:hypothetical protein [Lederbergia citri]MBS4193484.1 hypothetical protein [Lederbergia citri]
MKPPKNNSQTIEKLNELYVTTRRKYLVQTESTYFTNSRNKSANVWTLNDGMLARHLEGLNTYGVFNANGTNKFITFDVDFEDDTQAAKRATMEIIATLIMRYNITIEDIHVSVSGSKGYHIDLFFDEALPVEKVEKFYNNVIKDAGYSSDKVEFRPTWTQGVKLPLGIHQRTGSRCWFVNPRTLEPIKSFYYLNEVKPLPAALIKDGAVELTDEQEAEFREIEARTDTTITAVDASDALQRSAEILKAGRLVASNTRHSTTVKLAIFFNSQGFEQDEAVEAIMDVLLNTPREYFSKGSKPEFWRKEAERIVNLAFDRDYKLGNMDRPITIYRSEIIEVLNVGTFRQKQLAYAMLITSKRYGKVFYLTIKSAKKMLGIKSNETIQSGIKKLIEKGFIEYTRKNEVDIARSREVGHKFYKPNKYRLLVSEPAEGEQSVEVTAKHSLVEVARLLLDENEIKQHVNRREFTNRFKVS